MKQTPKDPKSGLKKSYVSGLSVSTALARKAHWAKTSKMDPKNPAAYALAPGDKEAKTKESKHTKAYRAKFGEETEMSEIILDEEAETGLAKKAKASGVSIDTLRKVYRRGVAAWRTGHRPGTTPQQWGMARVNSYITKGKGTYHGADKDLREDSNVSEGLWANIHAKRQRIKRGSGERMRKPGEKGAPTPDAIKTAQESFKTGETAERQSNNPNVSSSRFDGTDSLVGVYKKSTPGQIVKRVVKEAAADAKGYKSTTGGLTQKGRDHYNRISGGNLKAPVTTKPSKLKKGSKAANRRKSFCARMGGMKKRLTSAKTARDPDSRINKALRKWNC